MKIQESWLREWVNPDCSREELCEQLTMAGLEIDGVLSVAELLADNAEKQKIADYVWEVAITPNRGDCLSILGMAKEISALTNASLKLPNFSAVPAEINEVIPVKVIAKEDCPNYLGRIIRGVAKNRVSPEWMRNRLRCAGIKSIHPVVDITNYVMLELGQPMHAFTLGQISKEIQVRHAMADETLLLLDGETVSLLPGTFIIADENNPLAIAGVMGGLASGVTQDTQDIFLESAYFNPQSVARSVRHYCLHSDSSYRFERGVDPSLQRLAMERATYLIKEILGGEPASIIEVVTKEYLPKAEVIHLRKERVAKLLGYSLSEAAIENLLTRLEFKVTSTVTGWDVIAPLRRFDIRTEVDLIEELARLHGYNNLPCHAPTAKLEIKADSETKLPASLWRQMLCDLGYYEVITYSFIEANLQKLFSPFKMAKPLINPISTDMAVMRTSLLPGLTQTLIYNQNRQYERVRIFETGLCFLNENDALIQQRTLAGLIAGPLLPMQWGVAAREVDFFDIKGDLQSLFKRTGEKEDFIFEPIEHPALHPGQAANIIRKGQSIGIIGALHPRVLQELNISGNVFVFELCLEGIETGKVPRYSINSKFPAIRRDIAILVDQAIPSQLIQDTIMDVADEWLQEITIFDVYQGKGVAVGQKSIALGLTMQHAERTLVDEEVVACVERVVTALKERFSAELRG